MWYAAAYGAPVLSSVVILLVNQGLKLTVCARARCVITRTRLGRCGLRALFLFQFVNAGLVV